MASLYNNKISATYVGLIKTLDSAVINATLRELSDGLGNQTGLFINTSGDFKATGILEFGSLKDTGENITITKFVDEADGIANNDNDTTIPTSAAIIDYVASQVTLEDLDFSGDSGSGSVDLDTQTFAIVGTTNEIETSASGQQLQVGIVDNPTITGIITSDGLDVGDNEKIRLGASQDLEIYHDGSHSYINETGTGNLRIYTNDLEIKSNAGTETLATFATNGSVSLYYNDSLKLATSSTGLSVTGRISSLTDPTDAQDAATKAYVDSQVTAQDLDFGGDTGTGSVDLDSQSLSVTGTTNQVTTSATNQTLNISLPATVHRNLQGDVTGDLTGNVTATSVLADGVTATTQTDGDNSTKVATTAYVDTAIQGHDTLAEVLTGGNTTGGTNIAVSAGDDITFTDTSKAIFGDGSDLQIYHEGSDSYIKDAGTGNLNINADQLVFKSSSNTETKAVFNTNGAVELYHDDSKKLETVTNGVDITGNADVSGQITVGTSDTLLAENALRFKSSGDAFIDQNTVGQSLYLRTSNAASLDTNAVIIASDGDIDLSGSLTIAQDLTVNGTTTTVNTQTLAVEDPLISLAKDNAANSVDIGFYGRYNDGSNRYLGLYADASDTNTFKLFKGTTTEPTTTVDSTATGYVLADLDVATLTATSSIAVPSITLDEYITHTGDSDTYFGFPSANNFIVRTGGNTNLNISSSIVTLKHSGSTKFATSAGGINVTGDADISGEVQVGGAGSRFAENNLRFNSAGGAFIDHTIVGQSFTFRVSNASALDTTPLVIDSGGQSVFYGDITLDSDSKKLKLGDSQDLQLYHDGSNSYINETGSGSLITQTSDYFLRVGGTNNTNNAITVANSGTVTLYYSNSAKFETTSAGTTTTGKGTINAGTSSDIFVASNDSGSIVLGHTASLASIDLAASTALRVRQGSDIPFKIATDGTLELGANYSGAHLSVDGAIAINNGDQINLTGSLSSSGLWYGMRYADDEVQIYTYNAGGRSITFNTGDGTSTLVKQMMKIDQSGDVTINDGTLTVNSDNAGNVVGGYFTNSEANTGAESVSLAFGLNRSGGDFVRQVKAITFGAEQQWTGTPSTVDGYLAFSTVQNETVNEKLRITSGGDVYNYQSLNRANTYYGYNAGNFSGTGVSNTAFGYSTGTALTTGTKNTLIGRQSAPSASTAAANTAVGHASLYSLTSAAGNTAVGDLAGYNITSNDNTVMGRFAGYAITTGTRNTAIGRSAMENGAGVTGDNNTAVGHNAMNSNTNGGSNVAIGAYALDANTVGSGSVAIGTYALTTDGSVEESVAVGANALGAQTSGRNSALGYHALQDLTTGNYNTALGGESAENITTGDFNVAVGSFAARTQTTGDANTNVGYQAGYSNVSGSRNTFLGFQAGYANTASDNIFIGHESGSGVTDGYRNVLIGDRAGRLLASGFENCYIGHQSGYNVTGGNYNTALGVFALRDGTTADRCTGVGRSALISNTSGDFNTALGMSAGESNTTGSNNTFLGYNAGTTQTTGSNNTTIGNAAQPSSASASNEVTLGNSSITALRCQQTSITSLSDSRDKKDVETSNYGLNVIDSLRPVTFTWDNRDESENKGKKDVGFIAQELQEVDDDFLRLVYAENPDKLEATYGRLIPVMVKAIQELKAEVDSLKNKCNCN